MNAAARRLFCLPLTLVSACPDESLRATSDAGGPLGRAADAATDAATDDIDDAGASGGQGGQGGLGTDGGQGTEGGFALDGGEAGPVGTDAGGAADAGSADAGPASPLLRFVALGDSGKGNEGQRQVAEAMGAVCAARGGCAFALMLGDNIYDTGVDDINDAQWQEKFEVPYADLDFPFYATLGNHDYGAPPIASFLGGIGIDPRRGAAQVDYTGVSQKFVMPDTHYRFVEGPVEFVSLNTTSLFWADLGLVESTVGFDDENDRMRQDLPAWAASSTAPWRIAFGHHPFLSNGPHGNAGAYDGVAIEGLVGSGTEIRDFMQEHVVGHFDVYLCGHDHSLQDLGTHGGTEIFVSGGGASHTDLEGENPAEWQAARKGFLLVEADDTNLTFTFVVVPDPGDAPAGPSSGGWYYAHSRSVTRQP